ncbi:OadG family protein [Selenihalanaerobacter shriftii]|uniref:OadG family protein n=1 Tax=Selenihalanaerobacter shriftii TaxID=142842 RepID=UPI001F15AB65|nr:OadG family protein [Selenihalanaerobacter shriftii]
MIITSLLGMGVVFSFLLLIYGILFSFKYIFVKNEHASKGEIIPNNNDLVEEELVSILTTLNYYTGEDLNEGEVIIDKAGRVKDEEIYCSGQQ